MRNIKIAIEYDGTHYHGWQRQKDELTIQEVLEDRIGVITGERVTLIGSGRTDAGVHALNQVANFSIQSEIDELSLLRAINSLVPKDIAVKSLEEVDRTFHARFDVKRKAYIYRIFNRPVRSPLYRNFTWQIHGTLDVDAMGRAAQSLEGRHDFSSFCAANGDSLHHVRTITTANFIVSKSGIITFSIEADGFLRYMVRNIVGTLVDVGRGKIDNDCFIEILHARDRTQAGMTAPPQGLFLKAVYY